MISADGVIRRFLWFLTGAALAFGFAASATAKGHLKALVIGNDAYQNMPAASASVSNAEEIGMALGELGFNVSLITDGDAITFWQKFAIFSSAAVTSGPDTLNVIYFAGRTAVENGQTYLLPIDVDAGAGIGSRAIALDQIISLSAAGGGGVFVVLDLEQSTDEAGVQFGVGQIAKPSKGLITIIERAPDVQLDDETGEAFAITFSDEIELPNLLMGPFIELVAEGARTYSGTQLSLTFIRGERSGILLNPETDKAEVDRQLQLRAYDIARTGSNEELAAFAELYPDFELADAPVADAPRTVADIQDQQPLLRPVTFTAPLSGAGKPLDGLSISEIIKLKPKHSPLEGLPKIAWEDKSCSSCHKWNQAALCEHGARYQGDIWNRAKEKSHPLGGGFKRVLRAWAADGCLEE